MAVLPAFRQATAFHTLLHTNVTYAMRICVKSQHKTPTFIRYNLSAMLSIFTLCCDATLRVYLLYLFSATVLKRQGMNTTCVKNVPLALLWICQK